jgi:16S rRNA G966 N2-methylase RsmD
MKFLKQINWQTHDGVAIQLINDFGRNYFYNRILNRYVKNKKCTDVGFGTGILSMLALKHGAENIRAFEVNYNRYLLGKEIINRLNLNDKIHLINDRYDHNITPTEITFTETVNKQIWQEGIWNSLPKKAHDTIFLPGTYFLEIWAVEVSEKFARELCFSEFSYLYFDPGIDWLNQYTQVLNELSGFKNYSTNQLSNGFNSLDSSVQPIWNQLPQIQKALKNGELLAKYDVSYYQENVNQFSLTANTSNWKNKTILIIPRTGMQQDSDKLYLDSGHWNPTQWPTILHRPSENIVIEHNINDGSISYNME